MNGYVSLTIKVQWNLTAGLRFPLSRKHFSTFFFYNTVWVIAEEPPAICYYQTEMAQGSRGEAGKVAEVYGSWKLKLLFVTEDHFHMH